MVNNSAYWQTLYQQSQQLDLQQMAVQHMEVNRDLSKPASVDSRLASWLPSPAKGVKRLILERQGGEQVSRATSIVAYAADSQFSSHSHPKGEEFYVLFGTFSDQHGDYPAGSYVRNPPGSAHSPFSRQGCLIWVKLQQFAPGDKQRVVIDTLHNAPMNTTDQYGELELFKAYEQVSIIQPQSDMVLPAARLAQGIEILVLAGVIQVNDSVYQQGQWLRFPQQSKQHIVAFSGCRLLLKIGHLTLND